MSEVSERINQQSNVRDTKHAVRYAVLRARYWFFYDNEFKVRKA